MSILKRNRKASRFEVFHHLNKLRRDNTEPVDVNTYTRFGEAIQTEINLIKGWRKSDNKFKGHYKIMSKLRRQLLDELFKK